ncbi:helix-turn-helix domain-containing protein [Glutamicibacter sp. JL.03c]|uniref:helix-turn-helix domain-containing protein n=1 Tax=Glutamicibacter sp. JL.03c TaxID=2984842 RepID=UPI0039B109D9
MSLRQLQRAWRDAAGDSPAGWWRAYRLQRAEGMLAAGLPLAFVARCVGYEHVSNFSRALHRARGLRPGAVRPHPDSGQRNII